MAAISRRCHPFSFMSNDMAFERFKNAPETTFARALLRDGSSVGAGNSRRRDPNRMSLPESFVRPRRCSVFHLSVGLIRINSVCCVDDIVHSLERKLLLAPQLALAKILPHY